MGKNVISISEGIEGKEKTQGHLKQYKYLKI